MQRIEIDGVPFFTTPGPARATAALVFGVGLRDETFATQGITHLIEHLVMGTLPKSHLESNATVDVESTIFYATGRPAAVAAFLEGVCAALADPPFDRMDKEIGVLQAENCTGSHPTASALWAARFRLNGPGLAMAGGGVPEWLTEEAVRAHARKWFVRDNAAAMWHGDRPEQLRLVLPEGPRPSRPHPPVRVQTGPLWMQGPAAGAGLLLRVSDPADAATGVGVDVLAERMRDVARKERGLSYHADLEIVDIAPAHREVAVVVDAREGQEAAVAQLLWEQYLDLCEHGPSPAELEHAVDGFAEHLDSGDDVALSDLSRAAFTEVFDLPFRPAADGAQRWRAVTPGQVAAALRTCRPDAILMVPEQVDPGPLPGGIERGYLCSPVTELPSGTVFRPSLLARALHKAARLTLVVNEAGLAHRDADGDGHFIPWPEVEAAVPAIQGYGVFVVGRNLCGIDVHEDVYGRRAVDAVRAQLPPHVFVQVPPQRADSAQPEAAGAR
ncbi:insulinase family protein [Blastococcus sp. PRF04-17]|uniref:insulinase family protein n=1 Tax=Blastococcus sp. PRF04-17 TaxID=2933797 RepID=UPI001FF1D5F3|nr:insulinase family protein [Blastococcus sp. PRF04-17]UOY01169.1 insulinase family protein [Blastococcus sp. PRF04-17]